jgi:hypothetical protein
MKRANIPLYLAAAVISAMCAVISFVTAPGMSTYINVFMLVMLGVWLVLVTVIMLAFAFISYFEPSA